MMKGNYDDMRGEGNCMIIVLLSVQSTITLKNKKVALIEQVVSLCSASGVLCNIIAELST